VKEVCVRNCVRKLRKRCGAITVPQTIIIRGPPQPARDDYFTLAILNKAMTLASSSKDEKLASDHSARLLEYRLDLDNYIRNDKLVRLANSLRMQIVFSSNSNTRCGRHVFSTSLSLR